MKRAAEGTKLKLTSIFIFSSPFINYRGTLPYKFEGSHLERKPTARLLESEAHGSASRINLKDSSKLFRVECDSRRYASHLSK